MMEEKLRFLLESEKQLEVFHIFNKNHLQCLERVNFILNGAATTCNDLQIIKLPPSFKLEYGGAVLTENHLKDVITQMATSWMNDYKFSNLQHSFWEPIYFSSHSGSDDPDTCRRIEPC